MNADRWQHIQELMDELQGIPEPERRAFLDRATRKDPELRETLEAMLKAEGEASSFLKPPHLAPPVKAAHPPDLPDYQFLEPVGQGGLGVVWLARQESLSRLVAIKLLSERVLHLPESRERFRREAQAVAKLQHANIVRLFDSGVSGDLPYLVFEYIQGIDLAEEIETRTTVQKGEGARREPTTGTLRAGTLEVDFEKVARLTRKVADALDHAHGLGVVHRDVKPHNILLHEGGEPYLLDFGIAQAEDQATITGKNSRLGTPAYMSPEQITALRVEVDHRTDVYSLGVVLYELLCGQRPFHASTAEAVMHAIVDREPPRLRQVNPRVPKDLETICSGALEKNKERRYATAAALRDDLDRFLDGRPPQWRRPPIGLRLKRWVARHRFETGSLAVAVLGSLLAIVLAATFLSPPRSVSVTLDVMPESARAQSEVFAVRLNAEHLTRDAITPLGGWPLGPVDLGPGTYRFVAKSPGYASSEVQRVLPEAGSEVNYTLRLRPRSQAPFQLLPVPSGRVSLDHDLLLGAAGEVTLRLEHQVAGFELQEFPVTNREYADYLDETGGLPPPHWAGPRPSDWDRRPATGLRLEEARAFAEHYGLRLPTRPEIQLAAGGGRGWLYPWGNRIEPSLLSLLQVGKPEFHRNPDYPASEENREARWYREHVRPVDEDPDEARGPFGHGGLFGNVWITTESPHLDGPDGEIEATEHMHFLAGECAFTPLLDIQTKGTAGPYWQHAMKPGVYTGFRCVRSLAPLSLDPATQATQIP